MARSPPQLGPLGPVDHLSCSLLARQPAHRTATAVGSAKDLWNFGQHITEDALIQARSQLQFARGTICRTKFRRSFDSAPKGGYITSAGRISTKINGAAPQRPSRDTNSLPLTTTPRPLTGRRRADSTISVPLLCIQLFLASNQAVLASSGAFQNLTQYLPPGLATYVNATIDQLSDALAGSNEYLAAQGLSPTVIYSTLACAALAVPLGMSRYGWSNREGLSPFASQDVDGAPRVTEEDFSYITSEDLEHSLQAPTRAYDPKKQPPSSAKPEDDILLIKNKGIIYPVHFPAYSIGDGKLYVRDVRDRVGLVMEVSSSQIKRIKMLYKGRQLKDQDVPIRDYNVKNNSEILVVLPDGVVSDDDSGSSEEIVVADPRDEQSSKNKSKNKRRKKKTRGAQNLDVPGTGAEGRKSDNEESRQPSRMPSPPSIPSGAVEKLQAIQSHFNTRLLPLCVEFSASPPRDKKKCEEEHRKLSETIMQQVLLKLDEVDTGGDPDIRAKRKQLVNQVHDVLKGIDEHLPEGSVKPQLY
ncbi:bag domain protein [Seiridium cupressi]